MDRTPYTPVPPWRPASSTFHPWDPMDPTLAVPRSRVPQEQSMSRQEGGYDNTLRPYRKHNAIMMYLGDRMVRYSGYDLGSLCNT